MKKLKLKEKLLEISLAIVMVGISYGIISNFGYTISKFNELFAKSDKLAKNYNLKGDKKLDGKLIGLNNKKYLGRLNEGPFNYLTYSFISPPMNFDQPPIACNSMEFYKSNLTNSEDLVFLDVYHRYKNNDLETSVRDTSDVEFNARQDTLRMLIKEYNSDQNKFENN